MLTIKYAAGTLEIVRDATNHDRSRWRSVVEKTRSGFVIIGNQGESLISIHLSPMFDGRFKVIVVYQPSDMQPSLIVDEGLTRDEVITNLVNVAIHRLTSTQEAV